jgi:hypothetical protein
MSWRSTVQILVAFALAALTVWFSPDLLAPLGLGEFAFIGQVCLAVLVLSALEALFRRLPEPRAAERHPPPAA